MLQAVSYLAPSLPESLFEAVVDRVARGAVDAATIESNVLALALRDPSLDGALRVVETWGPFPVQPVVARTSLDARTRRALRDALLAMRLESHGLAGFTPDHPS